MKAAALKEELVEKLSRCKGIKGIAQTGDLNAPLIPGKSDVDLFVLCTDIPSKEERQAVYAMIQVADFTLQMEVCQGGLWGYGDILAVDEIDIMPMFFTEKEMREYLEEVLQGRHMEKDGRFYPVGRLASVGTINILYEEADTWTALVHRVNCKPYSFFKAWFESEIGQVLDEEDLGRAVLHKEVLFCHQVFENAIDHLLQALFAVNLCYFPSRKRTGAAIDSFRYKPDHCFSRLLAMVSDGAKEETIETAVEELRRMTFEIKDLGSRYLLSEEKENRKWERTMEINKCVKEAFVVIGKEGSTGDGEGFIQKLWENANSHFGEVEGLAKKDETGKVLGIWGAMSDLTHSFLPWEEEFSKGLYLAGVECVDEAEAPDGWTKWIIPGYEYIYVENEDGLFPKMIQYLRENNIPLAGAVHDFNCPETGKAYMFFPIRRL